MVLPSKKISQTHVVRVGSPVEIVVKQRTALLQALHVGPEAVRVVRVGVVFVGRADGARAARHLVVII